MQKDFTLFKARRKALQEAIKAQYPNKKGIILLFAGFESSERYRFRQESSFYYYTGLEEPGVVLMIDMNGQTTLFVPNYDQPRTKWVESSVQGASKQQLTQWGIDELLELGASCLGYQFSCIFSATEYENVLSLLKKQIALGTTIFTLNPSRGYTEQRLLLERLVNFVPEMTNQLVDVSSTVARMRRIKSQQEIEAIFLAIDCTMTAHEAAASYIDDSISESEIQASIEYIFTESMATPAFPSIVAGGARATTLHYTANKGSLKRGELCLVDIGAELNYYCADLTRTYPVSGTFTKRQRELYDIVLNAQEYIAEQAKPGIWLSNKDKPKQSLQHLAQHFFDRIGYGSYFTHGIGHFLGMDVHDVGDKLEPLQDGDIITIEPGLYIPEEKIGIRIEDNYWIATEGIVCLSELLAKNSHAVEDMMAQDLESCDDEDYD